MIALDFKIFHFLQLLKLVYGYHILIYLEISPYSNNNHVLFLHCVRNLQNADFPYFSCSQFTRRSRDHLHASDENCIDFWPTIIETQVACLFTI